MAALWNTAGHYIFVLWFLLYFHSFFLTYSQPSPIGCLPYKYGVALVRIYDAGLKRAGLAENTERKKSPKIRHLRTIAQLTRAISIFSHTMYKYVLNSVIKMSMMFAQYAQYFEYYAIILGGHFLCTRCKLSLIDSAQETVWWHKLANVFQFNLP